MKAMILAAGRGTRMGELTAGQPKPLLRVGGMALIEHQVRALAAGGYFEQVINVCYEADQIKQALGSGRRFGVSIEYATEYPYALETAGGIAHAMTLLACDSFIVVNADIWSDFSYSRLPVIDNEVLAHLVLVPNAVHHPQGDFDLSGHQVVFDKLDGNGDSNRDDRIKTLTFSGIGVYHRALFDGVVGKVPLAPLLNRAVRQRRVTGQYHSGLWWDVGTPERLEAVDQFLKGQMA